MKILQINAVCDTGSTGRTCRELSDWLLAHGHDSLVVYGNGHSDYEHAVKISSKFDNSLHGFLARLTGYNAHYSYFATRKLFRIINDFKPDVVHLRNLHGNYVNVPHLLRFLGENDIPTVITLHDCWPFTGKCTHYTSAHCYRWQGCCGNCPRLQYDIPSWFFDRTKKMLLEKKRLFEAIPRLAVIGVSDWVTNEARVSILGAAKIIQRIYNWIDTETFQYRSNARNKLGIADGEFTVLFISAGWTVNSDKYHDLELIANILNEQGIKILLAGHVPADATILNLPSVKYLGYLQTIEQLATVYSAADVYVHLSREDTFGKVIAESLSCGTPVIVYNQTACPELVSDGCGYVIPVGDIEVLTDKIFNIKKKSRKYFAANCRNYVIVQFTKENLIQQMLQCYSRLQETND